MNLKKLICAVVCLAFTEATPNPHALVSMTTTTKPIIIDKPSKAKQNTTEKDIFLELGKNNEQQIIEESIYNEKLKICWGDILYVNQSNDEIAEIWHDYQVTLDFPGDNNDSSTDKTTKEYRKYIIQEDDGNQAEHVFEVVKKNSNFIISKNENITCRTGTFLSKTYYEWPQTGNKKIVLRMADEHPGLKFERDDFANRKKVDEEKEDILGSPRALSEKESDEFDMDDTFEDFDSIENNSNKTTEQAKAQNKDSKDLKNNEEDSLSQVNNQTNSGEIVSHQESVITEYSQTRNQVLPSVNPCSPILTQLLAGNGIFPGLCNLRKNETVVLQGDIVVFKKYFSKVDNKEMVKPMFVIHEKTEIESRENDTSVVDN